MWDNECDEDRDRSLGMFEAMILTQAAKPWKTHYAACVPTGYFSPTVVINSAPEGLPSDQFNEWGDVELIYLHIIDTNTVSW